MGDMFIPKNRMEEGGDKWVVGDGGLLDVEDGGELAIKSGGTLSLESGSILNIENGGALDVSSGSDLDIESGGHMDVESGGTINVLDGATLAIEAGATVTGLNTSATFASEAEAIAGTVADKEVAPDTLKAAMNAKLAGVPWDADFVVGSEGANKINVGIQLKDVAGADLAVRGSVKAYLSDDANGDSIVATAPSGGAAIGTDGLAIPVVAGKAFDLVSESDGDIDIDITEAGTKTCYLIVVLPNGKLVASDAITFAA